MKNFLGIKNSFIYRLNTKIRLKMLGGFEIYSRWVPLKSNYMTPEA